MADDRLWCLVQDGRPTLRGLTREQAERAAAERARKYEGHKAGTRIRVPAFDIRPDTDLMAQHDANYKWYKENK